MPGIARRGVRLLLAIAGCCLWLGVAHAGSADAASIASNANPAEVGSVFTVTLHGDYAPSDFPNYAIQILDLDNGNRVLNSCQAATCTYSEKVPWKTNPDPQPRHFGSRKVYIPGSDPQAPGPSQGPDLTVGTVAHHFDVSLADTPATVTVGNSFLVKATNNVDLFNTGLALQILDADNADHVENSCAARTCSVGEFAHAGEDFRHFRARVVAFDTNGNPIPLDPGDTAIVSVDPNPQASDSFGCVCHILGSPIQKLLVDDPVNTITGNLAEEATDLAVGGRGLGLTLTRSYNSLAAVSGAADAQGPFGWGWTSTWRDHLTFREVASPFGDVERIITVHNGDGSTTPFRFVRGQVYRLRWLQSRLDMDPGGGYTYTLPDQRKMHFSSSGRLESAEDENGNMSNLHYDSGRLSSVSDSAGRSSTLSYNPDGTVASATDPSGASVSYGYTGGELTSVTDPDGKTTQYGYSGRKLTTITDARGHTVTNTYDSEYRVTRQQDRAGQVSTWTYYPDQTFYVDRWGVRWRYAFDRGVPTSVTRANGQFPETETIGYDTSLRPSVITDAKGHVWTYVYSAQTGDMIRSTDPLSRQTTLTYDGKHHVTSVTRPSGNTVTYTYDGNGNLTKTEATLTPSSTTLTWTNAYNGTGDLTSTADPLNHTWSYGHNSRGDQTSITSPRGYKTTYGYDSNSRPISRVSARGNEPGASPADYASSVDRDALGLVTRVTDPRGHVTTYTYDDNHNLEQVTDSDGKISRYAYDNENRQVTATRGYGTASATTTTTAYSPNGRVDHQIDGLGKTTQYEYDLHGRVVGITDPLNRVTRYAYDLAGNLSSVTDASARTETLSYDAANQLTGVSYSTGTPSSIAYSYTQDGQLHTATSAGHTSTLSYDSLGRLVSSTDGEGQTSTYHYDDAGRLTALDYPDVMLPLDTATSATQQTVPAGTVSYDYDADDRNTKITDWLNTATTFDYNAEGAITKSTRPGVSPTSYAYNRTGALSSMTVPGLKQNDPDITVNYRRSNADRLTSDAGRTYGYDPAGRLTSAGGAVYTYDAADNLTRTIVPETTTAVTQTFDGAHQLQTATPAGGTPTDFAYSPLGERLSATLRGSSVASAAYQYDQASRLARYEGVNQANPSGPKVTQVYGYDPLGARVTKKTGSVLTRTAYDVSAGLPLAIEDAGTAYIFGPDGLPLEQIDSAGTQSFYTHDQLGSTTRLSTKDGWTQATYTYDAHGHAKAAIGGYTYVSGGVDPQPPGGVILPSVGDVDTHHIGGTRHTVEGADTPLRFAGEYTDVESGLQYLRARYYDPTTGQFLTRDPIEALTRQPYSYADSDPANATDPTGLIFIRQPGGGGGSGFGASELGPVGDLEVPRSVVRQNRSFAQQEAAEVAAEAESSFAGRVLLGTEDCVGLAGAAKGGFGRLRTFLRSERGGTSSIPGKPFRGRLAPQKAYQHLADHHGVDPGIASERLHRVKAGGGLGATDDVVIGKTGDVYDAATEEWLGSLTDKSLGP